MILPEEFEDAFTMTCEQGQALEWLELREAEQLHWFGVTDPNPLCTWCWQQSSCPRHFSFPPSDHEIMFGTIPLSSRVARQLLRQARSWIEATQSYDKNQLGLSQLFLNSLRLTWILCLLPIPSHCSGQEPSQPSQNRLIHCANSCRGRCLWTLRSPKPRFLKVCKNARFSHFSILNFVTPSAGTGHPNGIVFSLLKLNLFSAASPR